MSYHFCRLGAVTAVFLIFFSGILPAQPAESPKADVLPRAEVWKNLRLEKARSSSPREKSGLEKGLLYLESRRLDEIFSIRYKDFYPKFGTPSPGSGIGAGLRFFKSKTGGAPLALESSFLNSTRNYRLLDLQFGRFDRIAPEFFVGPPDFGAPFEFGEPGPRQVDRSRYFLYADLRYRYFPQEDFFGLGNDSLPDRRTSYLEESYSVEAVAGYQVTPWLAAAFRMGPRGYNIEPGTDKRFPTVQDLFDDSAAPGLAGQPNFLFYSAGIFVNLTDRPGNPHKGGVLGVSLGRFDDVDTNSYNFLQWSVDARGYLPLGSPQRVLAVRAYTSNASADSGSRVPFYLQATLGGNSTLRGFEEFRFRGHNLVYLSSEYRWEPAPALELALFYDTGKVYPDGVDLTFDHFKSSIGAGIRVKTTRRTIVRFDVGRSSEGTRVQLRFGPSF